MKRFFDLCVLFTLLPLAMPLLLALYIGVYFALGAPVFFRQTRAGQNGKPFDLLKFRTMTDERDADGGLLPDAERLTRFGLWLRKTSLDELPELLNILRGDMSFVGPRPLLLQYLPRYSKAQLRRHEALPGLTGWAQVNGRNAIGWDMKFDLDVWYVDNQSIWLDLKIIVLTAIQVITRRGISADGEATMPEFMGDRK